MAAMVLKKTLQARAKRAGIKGFSTMTKAQLVKALEKKKATQKRKPKSSGSRKTAARKTTARRTPTRRKTTRKAMSENGTLKKYDLRKFLQELEGEIKGDIMYGEITTIDDIQDRIDEEIDREVIYNEDSALICIACNYYDWEAEGVYWPVNSMPQAAYAALQEQVREITGLKERLEEYLEENA
jgi:hypothetical protein